MVSAHEPRVTVAITLSGSDRLNVKEATQALRRLLGADFSLLHGPIEEAGSIEVGCEYRLPAPKRVRQLRVIQTQKPIRAR